MPVNVGMGLVVVLLLLLLAGVAALVWSAGAPVVVKVPGAGKSLSVGS
jgi:hypothetical protein